MSVWAELDRRHAEHVAEEERTRAAVRERRGGGSEGPSRAVVVQLAADARRPPRPAGERPLPRGPARAVGPADRHLAAEAARAGEGGLI